MGLLRGPYFLLGHFLLSQATSQEETNAYGRFPASTRKSSRMLASRFYISMCITTKGLFHRGTTLKLPYLIVVLQMSSSSGRNASGNSQSQSSPSRGRTSSSQVTNESSNNRESQGQASGNASSAPRPVPIAPSAGPTLDVLGIAEEEFTFECQVEGCTRRFKHKSSRSRHKTKCHPSSRATPHS